MADDNHSQPRDAPHVSLDLRGARCPVPVLRLDKAMREGAAGVDLTTDDPVARVDVPDLCAQRGWRCEVLSETRYRITR